MSYLNSLRLHFAGTFQASISTVNNNPQNFEAALHNGDPLDGSWNARGDAAWRLLGCKVTSAWLDDGSAVGASDPILSYIVADSDRQVTAKLVDLDPQQQLVSTIWGLEVRICTSDGTTLLRGKFKPAAFIDLWNRVPSGPGGPGDFTLGGMYQSVLTDLQWGDISDSPFLRKLRKAAKDDLLSIKFNVDGYNMNFSSPDFTRGRIVGTIGPASDDEPQHMLRARQLMAPVGDVNYGAAVVDERAGKILLDLGNALPTAVSGGPMLNLGTIGLVCTVAGAAPNDPPQPLELGSIATSVYTAPHWYETTAGVVELPADRELTRDELRALAGNPLSITLTSAGGSATTALSEPPLGLYVRADHFVFRLNPGDTATVDVYATQYGQPYAKADVIAIYDSNMLQATPDLPVATPADAIDFPARVKTDAKGKAKLRIKADDPGNPRGFIDGQVYGVRVVLEDTITLPGGYPFNIWEFITLLVWDEFQPDEPPTWYGSLQPIFQQYARLYPVMDDFLDLSDYDSVSENRDLLILAYSLDRSDPNVMPVTRDLSTSRRKTILRWLRETGPDGKPLKGTPPAVDQTPLRAAPAAAPEAVAAPQDPGGKTNALNRRLGLQRFRR